ncbi:uncharacterized protein LOC128349727 isoform X2 [Hemicordylus capensis]|uniref:uncharacterized protein LOC128349727 isoform X2 n=1 Tax=Hemicordylus capensis TaxID=884348 RepID=UPI002301FE7E|nr:uncharacterized protein LOC128349727 isoform X2 [Hemicordylus capensis]
MPKKAKGKKGGKPIRQPKRPAPSPSSSEGEDEEMVVIRGLIGRMEALEKARAVPSDEGGGPSGLPGRVPKRTRGVTRAQLLRSISDRLGALERDGGLPGPGLPASPDVPVVPVPMSPSPLPVVPDAPVPADPTPLEPAEPVVPGAGGAAASVRVLICGHLLVFWAFKRASTSQWGIQLGLGRRASVYWLGLRGMVWSQLLPAIWDHLGSFPGPDVLVLHLGENDLGKQTGLSLVQQVSSNFSTLEGLLLGLCIVWVSWLQRKVWRGVQCVRGIERERRKASAAIGRLVVADGGVVLGQPGISAHFPQLFRPDGVHLSEAGCDLYLQNIWMGLVEFLEGCGAGRSS